MIQPEELCTKTRDRVMEVLHTKHPGARPPSTASLDTYPDRLAEFFPVYITDDIVTEVAGQLSGGAGPGGGRLSEPPAPAPSFCSDEQGVMADGSRLRGVIR